MGVDIAVLGYGVSAGGRGVGATHIASYLFLVLFIYFIPFRKNGDLLCNHEGRTDCGAALIPSCRFVLDISNN